MSLVGIWCTLVSIVFYLLSYPFYQRKWLSWAYAKALNVGVRFVLGIKVDVVGRDNMLAGPAVITMNHQSNFDPLLQGPVFPKNAIIIGKKDLLKIPFWGRLFRATNNIMVDRNARGDGEGSKNGAGVDEAITRLQADDCYVWIFPEGTRSHGEGLGQFKRGAFIMAIEAQVPIIPMISKPLHYVLDIPNKIAKGGRHEIKILPSICTVGMTLNDLPELITHCEQLYAKHLAAYLGCAPEDVFA
ncbi:1-acyl-sn-glycerol-3-phosphate acyltransferase [Arenicella xantha]|uniref:1-acyl-sn-glycerol-3-phosphate acyltransferase n=2 Tax=Arenicella xantha TaxID=644221 RepID=A0A395JKW3_9GAMM|nr:1-acyl-sn-glycerol-3-phosphate acyltransferase [Arenicella xantha]